MLFSLRGVLMSPQFLFHIEASNPGAEPRLAVDYALASRLSYFLWGSVPMNCFGTSRRPAGYTIPKF